MTRYIDECVGCETCMGRDCPKRNIEVHYCDCCGSGDKLYRLDGEELCIDCIRKTSPIASHGECDYLEKGRCMITGYKCEGQYEDQEECEFIPEPENLITEEERELLNTFNGSDPVVIKKDGRITIKVTSGTEPVNIPIPGRLFRWMSEGDEVKLSGLSG